MIKFEYRPWEPDSKFDSMMGTPTVEELTMTLGDGVTWQEATTEFHNFLRGAGYVIPYEYEEEECEWVGLTGDERSYVRSEYLRGAIGILGVCDFCEAKLKEKNT